MVFIVSVSTSVQDTRAEGRGQLAGVGSPPQWLQNQVHIDRLATFYFLDVCKHGLHKCRQLSELFMTQ